MIPAIDVAVQRQARKSVAARKRQFPAEFESYSRGL